MNRIKRPIKIISGGQTGADWGGLLGAEWCGIKTGGWATKGYRTEEGPNVETLKSRFGLTEHDDWRYQGRTEQNVIDADMTIIFSDNVSSAGTNLTARLCKEYNKPVFFFDRYCNVVEDLIEFIDKHNPNIINIAGNRESVAPGISQDVMDIVVEIFQ